MLCTALLTDRLSLSDLLELAVLWALFTVALLGEQIMIIQWNPSNTDTLGPLKCVLIRGVSSFQGANNT